MRISSVSRASALAGALGLTIVAACAGSPSAEATLPTQLALGTWGSDGAGVIVSDTLAHVHVGCTKGDFPRPMALDSGRFNVAGQYILRAYPIQIGPPLPARFSGVVRGSLLTLSVAVEDTVERKLVVLGPITITLGREPRLGPCPICQLPARTR
ncbi:MAG: hypothetical protein IPK33_06285 [Gemmatimonadetes bacterium]|nr:hypothetical protein [Gemmatimonadota bacterium]